MTPSLSADVVVVGGGPAGLSAALVLGRATKRVVLCDGGARRNAASEHVNGFVTRDGIHPTEFRRIGREQLAPYPVTIKDVGVHQITARGTRGFEVTLVDGTSVLTRRVLLATGMVDEVPDLPGIRELWGDTVFQCPYCHGWEVRDRPWGLLANSEALLEWAIFVTGWTRDLVAFTNGAAIPEALASRLAAAEVKVERRPVRRLQQGATGKLSAVELEDGESIAREVLLVRPPQRQVALVGKLDLALDEQGFVRLDENNETSVPGIHAAGDLSTRMQGALLAAGAGAKAAFLMNHAMNMETHG